MKKLQLILLSLCLSVSLYAKNSYEGIVTDVLQGGGYTYLEIQEKTEKKFWIAVSGQDIKKGTEVRFDEELVAKDFKSKSLDRTFDSLMFASNLQYRTQMESPFITEFVAKSPYQAKDTISISELMNNANKYADKEVSVRAKVVKVSNNIMKKNWVHLQDGTGVNGEVGRVVFTSPIGSPSIGDIVTAKGKVSVDKDFGSGYVYKVIVEETTFTK
jgi:hypothetical protein